MDIEEARARARWEGEMEQRMQAADRRFEQLRKAIENLEEKVDGIDRKLAVVQTKVAVWAAVGGLVGAGVVTFIVAIGTKAIGP